MQQEPPFRILDAFRGYAALWVVMVHCCDRFLGGNNMAYVHQPLYAFAIRGQLGVILFCIISGYCITAAAHGALYVLHTEFAKVVFWSLRYEIAFYAIVGLWLWLAQRVARSRDMASGQLVPILELAATTIISLPLMIVFAVPVFPWDLWRQFAIGGLLFYVIESNAKTVACYSPAPALDAQWHCRCNGRAFIDLCCASPDWDSRRWPSSEQVANLGLPYYLRNAGRAAALQSEVVHEPLVDAFDVAGSLLLQPLPGPSDFSAVCRRCLPQDRHGWASLLDCLLDSGDCRGGLWTDLLLAHRTSFHFIERGKAPREKNMPHDGKRGPGGSIGRPRPAITLSF